MRDSGKEKVRWHFLNIFFAKHFTEYFAFDIKVKTNNSISYYSQFMSIEIEVQRGKILAQVHIMCSNGPGIQTPICLIPKFVFVF